MPPLFVNLLVSKVQESSPAPRDRDKTRQRIVEAAYDSFYRHGVARSGVDAIAAAAGLTKRTLYDHFDSKDALLAAVLERHHAFSLARIREWAGAETDSAVELLDNLFARLAEWAAGPEWRGSGFSRVAAELADQRGHPARAAAAAHKAAVEAFLASRLDVLGVVRPAAATEIMLVVEGAMSLALIHGDAAYVAAARRAAGAVLADRSGG